MNSQSTEQASWSQREIAISVAVVAAYLALAVGSAVTNRPWADEAYSASTAWNMTEHGSFGTTNIETAGGWLTRIDRTTYWVMPLYLVASGGWAEIFGASFISLRMMNVGWGLLALAAWFVILDCLSRNRPLALLGTALIALDYVFIRTASTARFEMQAATLGWLGVAAYLRMRGSNLSVGLLVANSLLALSLFSHPHAITIFLLLWTAVAALDFRRVRLSQLLLSTLPFIVCLAAWTWFITRDYQAFSDQFLGNARGRFAAPVGALGMLWREISLRYVHVFLGNETLIGPGRLKVLILVGYVAGVVGAIALPSVRRSRVGGFLLVASLITFTMFTALENFKNPLYLIYPVPLYLALLACVVMSAWHKRPSLHALICVAIGAFMLLNVAGILLVMRRNTYGEAFLPMISFVRSRMGPGDLLLGAPEVQFGLGMDSNVLDDVRLGFDSGKHPRLLVLDERYRGWFADFSEREPEVDKFVKRLLQHDYRLAYSNSVYEVFERKEVGVSR